MGKPVQPTPCKSCPWRKDTEWSDIPEFHPDNVESIAAGIDAGKDPETLHAARVMQCHDLNQERTCSGFVLSDDGHHHLLLRLAYTLGWVTGRTCGDGLDLHATWDEVRAQKGLEP